MQRRAFVNSAPPAVATTRRIRIGASAQAHMGLFGSVSGKQVDEFARALARELAERLPPADPSGRRKVSPAQAASLLERIFSKAVGYKNEHKLGVYKKARLGNAFRWELEALGYERDFAEHVTQGLVVQISGKR
jgi:hypothetical protein